jgi:hypothetical protein
MSTVAFRPAYSVLALDDADDKPLPGLILFPTASCRARLRDLGLSYRAETGGFRLFAQFMGGTGGVRRVPVAAEAVLVFAITLADPGFPARYRPPLTRATGPNLYLTNRTPAGAVRNAGLLTRGAVAAAVDAVRITGRRFRAPATVGGANPATALAVATGYAPIRQLADAPIAGPVGEAQVAIDLTGAPERAFTLAPKPPGTAFSRILADDEVFALGAFGVLDLVLRPVAGPDPAAGRAFTARFRRQ